MRGTWITDALCLTRGSDGWSCEKRTIEVREGVIVALHEGPVPAVREPGDQMIDARGLLAVAGLVNAHTHSPDNLIRGTAPDLPLELWSLHSAAGRERRTAREAYVSAALGAIEMLRSGTTTLLDHVRISPDIDAECLDAVADAYRDIGIRATVAPIVADRAVADTLPLTGADLGGADISAYGARTAMPAGEQIAIAESFARRWHGVDGRIHAAIGPSAPQRCTDGLLEQAGDLSARRGLILHMHLLETRTQQAMGFRLYGKGTVAHLAELELLNRRTNLAHAIWIEDGDLDRIAGAGAAIVHNPVSNARLGSGFCPLQDYLARGIRVGLGTDSACCNDSGNLLETAKWAGLLHNLRDNDPERWISPQTSLHLATGGGADVLGLGAVTGQLRAGYAADITLLRLASPAFVPLSDPVRQLVQAENGSAVERVLVAGDSVVENGRCVRVDEEAIWQEAQALSARRLTDNAGIYRAAAALDRPIRRMYERLRATHGESRP